MGGHEIGHHKLPHAHFPVQLLVFCGEPLIDRVLGLAHELQHRVADMLRGHLQLTGDMVFHQLTEEAVVLVRQQIVKPDAAADKHLFHPGQCAKLLEQAEIIAVVRNEIFAGGGEQALLGGTYALGLLLFTGGLTEVGGGAAHIVDIALELRVRNEHVCLFENGLVAAGLDDPPLMEGQRTEATAAEAAPAAGQTEFDLFDGVDAPVLFVHGVIGAHIGQVVGIVHLLGGQGLLGRVLHHIGLLVIGLHQSFCHIGVGVAVLGIEALGIDPLIGGERRVVGEGDIVIDAGEVPGLIDRAPDKRQVRDGKPAVQGLGHLHNTPLAHTIEQQVRLGVQEDRAL